MNIRCFMIDPAGRARLSLRRYRREDNKCTATGWIHNAEVPLFEVDETFEFNAGFDRKTFRHMGPQNREELPAEYQKLWPTVCVCGYVFTEDDPFQVFSNSLYKRRDNGEIVTLRAAPIGAMWWVEWMEGFFHPQLGTSPLCVMTPGGEWMIDSRARNCTMPDDYNQERHHCWIAHGAPPDVTVDKNGTTCAAGAGSIQAGSFHGFLRNGYLEGG